MNWMFLYIAIVFEVAGTGFLKMSDGMEKPLIFALALGLYTISFYFLGQSLKAMPIGITYAIWSGVGTLLIVLIGFFWFNEQFTLLKAAFMAMIIIGAIGLNLTSSSH